MLRHVTGRRFHYHRLSAHPAGRPDHSHRCGSPCALAKIHGNASRRRKHHARPLCPKRANAAGSSDAKPDQGKTYPEIAKDGTCVLGPVKLQRPAPPSSGARGVAVHTVSVRNRWVGKSNVGVALAVSNADASVASDGREWASG